ncbi:MAG: hypothetical protein KDD94_12470, partial [Calditrichaeota bacterium]|nr:hypothetical protein [Calditrichota bacterium]
LKQETDFSKKLENYRTLSIVRYALLEAPSLLSLVLFFLSSDFFFLMISALLIFLLILIKPSRERLISELEPNPQELELLNN